MRELIERFRNFSSAKQLAIGGGTAVALILITTAFALSGGDDEPDATASTTTVASVGQDSTTTTISESSTTTTLSDDQPQGSAWSLTGVSSPAATPTAPILVAKIDNSSSSRPQTGLTQADMVIEVLVEGGVARFLAFYQSEIPGEIGPIRSVREVDSKLFAPFGVVFAHSGGVSANIAAIREVAVDAGDPVLGSTGYGRDPDRPAPYDLMLNPRAALDLAAETSGDIWFRFDEAVPQGEQALTIDLALSPVTQPTYRWSSADEGFLRFHGATAHTDDADEQVIADNVIVLYVRQLDTGRTDGAGNPVPDFQVTGSGDAYVFRDGIAVSGTWERGTEDGFFRILDEAGQQIPLKPGNVWIELTPIGRSLAWQ